MGFLDRFRRVKRTVDETDLQWIANDVNEYLEEKGHGEGILSLAYRTPSKSREIKQGDAENTEFILYAHRLGIFGYSMFRNMLTDKLGFNPQVDVCFAEGVYNEKISKDGFIVCKIF